MIVRVAGGGLGDGPPIPEAEFDGTLMYDDDDEKFLDPTALTLDDGHVVTPAPMWRVRLTLELLASLLEQYGNVTIEKDWTGHQHWWMELS